MASDNGYSKMSQISLCILTSGVGAYGRKNLKNLNGHMVMGGGINVSEVTRFVCDMERLTLGLDNPWWMLRRTSHGGLPLPLVLLPPSAPDLPLPPSPPPLVHHLDLLGNPSFNSVRESEDEGERQR